MWTTVIFEGEYLNGKRWDGKGKEYNDDGELLFEGEYLKTIMKLSFLEVERKDFFE